MQCIPSGYLGRLMYIYGICIYTSHRTLNSTTQQLSLELIPIPSFPGMCTRPFRPRPRRDRDVGHFVRDETETETETFQLPRPWPRRVVKKIKHHKINWTSKHFVFVMLWDFVARALCALRGIAAVRPSVCSPSVTLRYRGHISWDTSKITLRSSLLGEPTSAS